MLKREMKYQFNEFLEYAIEQLDIQYEELIDNIYLKSLVLDICGKALVLIINEKSRRGELSGENPESRYDFFEERYSKSGKVYQQLMSKYPTIYHDLMTQVHVYVALVKRIKERFNSDRQLLVNQGIIHNLSEEILFLKIKGDFHNGKAVVELTTNLSKLIYKPKSVKNDVFFYKILEHIKALDKNEERNARVLGFYNLKILDQDSYGWVEFLNQEPVSSLEEANRYYKRVGYLLSIAYMINLTDLHFENIICKGEYPNIIDLETLFSISMFESEFENEATDSIQSKISNSVYATGMLPVLGNENQFGGDTSGILGGSFTREERVIINPFRDDIQFEKKIIRQKSKDHIPYIIKSKQKEYCNPYNYLDDIDDGFSLGYQLILRHKDNMKFYIESESKSVSTRILIRNTMEYSALIQAAKSPIYADKRAMIFEKLKSFDKGLEPAIIEAEINQLSSLSIPFFMCKLNSVNVTDLNGQIICKLIVTPFEQFLSKLEMCNFNDLNQQKKLIDFSIHGQEKLFKDGESFSEYHFSNGTQRDIDDSIRNLVKIIESNAFIGEHDQSINWMNLGVSMNDQIVFESLGNDIYKGLSGIGISLLEYNELAPNWNTESILKLIYASVKKGFVKKLKENSAVDYSFYNGLIGELAFLKKYEEYFKISDVKFPTYLTRMIHIMLENPFELNDLIAGEAGIIIYLCGLDDKLTYKKEIKQLGNKLLNSLNLEQCIASYAHGNSGVMTALLYVYQLFQDKEFLVLFFKLLENEKKIKISRGWKDCRQQGNNFAAYWCHGATGQTLARMMWLDMDKKCKFLNSNQYDKIIDELDELIDITLNEGMDESNFCLCHGIAGNLMIANFYQVNFDKDNKSLQTRIAENIYSICNHGLKKGWICGLGSEFYSYGMMTVISGILYALVRYKKGKDDLGILLPNMR